MAEATVVARLKHYDTVPQKMGYFSSIVGKHNHSP